MSILRFLYLHYLKAARWQIPIWLLIGLCLLVYVERASTDNYLIAATFLGVWVGLCNARSRARHTVLLLPRYGQRVFATNVGLLLIGIALLTLPVAAASIPPVAAALLLAVFATFTVTIRSQLVLLACVASFGSKLSSPDGLAYLAELPLQIAFAMVVIFLLTALHKRLHGHPVYRKSAIRMWPDATRAVPYVSFRGLILLHPNVTWFSLAAVAIAPFFEVLEVILPITLLTFAHIWRTLVDQSFPRMYMLGGAATRAETAASFVRGIELLVVCTSLCVLAGAWLHGFAADEAGIWKLPLAVIVFGFLTVAATATIGLKMNPIVLYFLMLPLWALIKVALITMPEPMLLSVFVVSGLIGVLIVELRAARAIAARDHCYQLATG